MTIALSLTILVLIGISVWQIAKIFELSQGKKENTQIANDNDNRYNGQLMFAFLLFIYGITLFSFWKWGEVLLPEAASEHGTEYDNLMWISFAIIFFVQTITQALLHYFAYKYHGKKGQKAFFYADNDRLEAIWTIIPVITLAGLILYGLYTWTDIMSVEENEEALWWSSTPSNSIGKRDMQDRTGYLVMPMSDFYKILTAAIWLVSMPPIPTDWMMW